MTEGAKAIGSLARDVRIHVLALGRAESDIRAALYELAAARVLILAPNHGNIWAASPFCAVPSGFRVSAAGKQYWGICIWDALGIEAAINLTLSSRRPVRLRRVHVKHDAALPGRRAR